MEDYKHKILVLRDDMDLNKVILLGRVGKDPDFLKMSNGEEIGKLRLATSYSVMDKSTQQYKSITSWHNVVIYSQILIKTVRERVRKGTKIYVEGAIKYTEYTSKDGTQQKSTQIEIYNSGGVLKIAEQPKAQNVIPEHEDQESDWIVRDVRVPQPKQVQMQEDEFLIDDELPF